jgi:hypothetical protein
MWELLGLFIGVIGIIGGTALAVKPPEYRAVRICFTFVMLYFLLRLGSYLIAEVHLGRILTIILMTESFIFLTILWCIVVGWFSRRERVEKRIKRELENKGDSYRFHLLVKQWENLSKQLVKLNSKSLKNMMTKLIAKIWMVIVVLRIKIVNKKIEKESSQFSQKIAEKIGKEKYNSDVILYYTRNEFRGNLISRHRSTTQIFADIFGDPAGIEYWEGWFKRSSMNVEDYALLLAIHTKAEENDAYISNSQSTLLRLDTYMNRRKEVILALLEAREMGALKFKGRTSVLDDMIKGGTGVNIDLGIVQEYIGATIKQASLSQVKLYPYETLGWFAKSPNYNALLPESLRRWWDNQLPKRET